MITEPGVYDIPENEYHADPVAGGSLSCSEAQLLLESPARYRYRKLAGEEHRDTFDFGHAVHGLVLGVGREVVVVDAADWRTKDARAAKVEAHAAGRVPILVDDWEVAKAMQAAVYDHPAAAALLDRDHGRPEQTLVWRDAASGVMLRALVDWLRDKPSSGRLILADYKTTRDASARAFAKSAASYGYHQQAPWYCDGAKALLEVDAALVFIAQEHQPPYLVNVIELDATAQQIGRERNRAAIDLFVACTARDEWPGYGPEVALVGLPRWAELQHADDFGDTAF